MSIDSAAATILQRGVSLDNAQRYTESLVCYQEGLQLLVEVMKTSDGDKKIYLRKKIEEYMTRAEKIKQLIKNLKDTGKFHEQVQIVNDSNGHSYNALFGRFLDSDVQYINVEDPYIRALHQCQNFVRLCELCVKKCKNLKGIILKTTEDQTMPEKQRQWLGDIKRSLLEHNIKLDIIYSSTLHDRQIILSSGWIIKIGRGLDYFKKPANNLSLGAFEMDLRPCHETTVDVFHNRNVRHS